MKIYSHWAIERQHILIDGVECDPLYRRLCIKQGCYQARLTPKPYRMKMKAYKVRFPREALILNSNNGWRIMKEQAAASMYADSSSRLARDIL